MQIHVAESDADILHCLPVMRHLREISDPSLFLERVRSQQQSGYRLAALSLDERAQAVAGFRLNENLAWGRHLYVDDLVALPSSRSKGYGAALLEWLTDEARRAGCQQIHLDSGVQRKRAHLFYERAGFAVSSLHFARQL